MRLMKTREKRICSVPIWRTKGLVCLLLDAGQAHGQLCDDTHQSKCCARLRMARSLLFSGKAAALMQVKQVGPLYLIRR